VAKSISLEDLVDLNDEVAGLVRAGVPLPMGLTSWGRDLGGLLARSVMQLAERVSAGQSLDDAIASLPVALPKTYRAIVKAGMRSGRLSAALESLADTAQQARQARAAMGLAILYPLAVVLLGYVLFLFLVLKVLPAQLAAFDSPPAFWVRLANFVHAVSANWSLALFIPPLVVVILAIVWWRRAGSGKILGFTHSRLAAVPVSGRPLRESQTAALAEILGLLIEHNVPLPEAAVLTAECTADPVLEREAKAFAQAISNGTSPQQAGECLRAFPPLIAWLMRSGASQHTLMAMARQVALTHRERAARSIEWLRDVLPIWLLVGVGVLVVLTYALVLVVPFSRLLEVLTHVAGRSLRFR
jgi:type II secretory pathway component PulF